jgi:hypothetical protein
MKEKTPFHLFGGKITDFISKEEKNFEQKHLKAYLKGKKYFRHGFKTLSESGHRVPAWFETKIINPEA